MKKKYLVILNLIISINIYGQVNFHVGPFQSYIPDPVAHTQESRMAQKEELIMAQAAIVAGAIAPLTASVVGYDNNLTTPGVVYSTIMTPFITACYTSITTQELTSGIPGLNRFDLLNSARNAIKLNTVRGIMTDHTQLMLPTNSMSDGERRLMSLKTIRLALKTTLNE